MNKFAFKVLSFLILLMAVAGCSFEDQQIPAVSHERISADSLKIRFQSVLSRQMQSLKTTGRRQQKLPVKAIWEEMHTYNSPTGVPLTVVPVIFENDLNFDGSYKLMVYYRDEKGKVNGFIAEKIFDQSRFTNYKNPEETARQKFSGKIVYYTEEGFFLGGQAYKDGQITGGVQIAIDGAAIEDPAHRRGKLKYNNCEVVSVQAVCPQQSTYISTGTGQADGTTGSVPTTTEQLNEIIANCDNVVLELGKCDGTGGIGVGADVYESYTPPAGYTPATAGPYPGGPSGSGGNSGNYILSDEELLAIEMIGRNLDLMTVEERNLIRSHPWMVETLLGIKVTTGKSEINVIKEAMVIWNAMDPDAAYQQVKNIQIQSQTAVATAITTLAEYTHLLYISTVPVVAAHPGFINFINDVLRQVKEPIRSKTDFNRVTMGWFDLFAIWILELGMDNVYDFKVGGEKTLTELKVQTGVNVARDAAISDAKANKFGQILEKSYTYGQEQFFGNLTNVVTSFIGSYVVKYKITNLGNHKASVEFSISNTSGWTSATRLRKAAKPGSYHQGIIPDKNRNDGIQLGGNLIENWIWKETITY